MSSSTTAVKSVNGQLFRNRFFQTILLSNVLLQVGIWVRNFAILLYVTDKTGNDPISVSLISVAEFAPIFVFSFLGGTLADRWLPKKTMIWCDFLSALSVFAVLLTIMFETWEAVYFATFISAILSQFSQPSAMRLFKQHIAPEQIQSAMAIFQTLMAVFMVAGPSLGVIVYQNFGIHTSIGVMGVAFLLSALVLYRIPADIRVTPTSGLKPHIWREMGEGLRYVWRSKVLRTLCGTFALAGLSIGIAQTLGLFVVTERLHQPKEFLQFILMINGVAMLIGGASVMTLSKRVLPQRLLALGMLTGAMCTVGIGFSTSVTLTLILQFINGLFFPVVQVSISTLMLQWSDNAYIGRVNGVLGPMFVGMMVIMMAVAGPLKTVLPLVTIYSIAGLSMFVGMLVLIPIFSHKPAERGESGEAQTPSTISMH
ncbi:MFS transporter [Paenibacillus baekrokdamisoli]|uniref:MFS transporter n=1 Tax=Paenibacillus baekrokdamisoli TaxID=1712516 RepID=A0A3G9IUK9_9BACL|nr:MFS transporter [Paenibacillus baekrokdamisoli]MBB3071536.1 MFS family permease [Paenibacillus baekrokdamisoli]BBH21952.1 MFS transporter [Paenibacillus baekrokdamisoli]